MTFLFSDIEGSTQRWERDRAAMQEAVRRHDALMRSAIDARDGHVFKTVGDAFCAVFARAEDAVAAALDAQRALGSGHFSAVDGLRVRMALHTGTADERDGDYFGPAVNRVARLLAIGHGGQVLVSGLTSDLVQGDLPPQSTLRDLGAHRLKDLARPEQVYQLLAPDLPDAFPALRSLDALPNNLPPQPTSFVGREKEVAEITAMIAPQRVVTLVGSGGVGKTRTSLQVGANLLDGSGDGVWFVELAPLADPALLPTTIASALGLTLPGTGDPLEALVRTLRPKRCLLILDNCEHLVGAAAAAAAAIVRGCPQVAILASSRQSLGVASEQTYRMPSLALPTEAHAERLTAADATRYSAVALFDERARVADKRFALTDETAPIVADICRLLDGIALAIELAAARVTILKPRELRARLDQRFRVLTRGSRDALPRQQTLRALIDWSFELLDERERRLFRRLGIFVNGFTLEGATAVAGDETLDEFEVFDLLASLVDKSLVVADLEADATRYRLLESTRAYAQEKLAEAGERESTAERHLRYLRDLFVRVGEAFEQTPREADLLALAVELDDARAALGWAATNGHAELGGELYAATRLWGYLGLAREAIAIGERYATLLEGGNPALLSLVLSRLAFAAQLLGQYSLEQAASERAVSLARTSGDASVIAWALTNIVSSLARNGRLSEAEDALLEADRLEKLSPFMQRVSTERRGFLARAKGDLDEAARQYERARAMHRALANDAAATLVALAEIEHQRGRTQTAIAHAQDAIASASRPYHRFLPWLRCNLAGYSLAAGDLAGARDAGRAALETWRKTEPDGVHAAIAIEHLALATAIGDDRHHTAQAADHRDAARDDLRCAARLEGYADARLRAAGFEREFTEQTTYDRLSALLRAHFAAPELEALLAEGAAWTGDDAIAEALKASNAPATESR
ncbi:MAG: adenylate/guanylate cyclase domain-containing protein [Candidatus Eremiobacteraeota bacterium]|nr:adenylate/guanylate cyclase domain-containing protein [Candidatus Eremiobacteraeota bacterium]